MLTIAGRLLLFIFFLSLSSCSAPHRAKLRYLFPPPPETPRLEWLATYASDDDFPKSEARRNAEKLAGEKARRLGAPTGIASDSEGRVFVGDLQAKNILVFDLVEGKTHYLLANGDVEPRQMTFDSHKQLYVVDSSRHCIKVFTRDGHSLRTYGDIRQLNRPLGVALDERLKRVYVSDGAENKVIVFDLETGKVLSSLGTGSTGKRDGDLYNPAGLSLAADGTLCVVEHLNARISLFNADGTFRKHFGLRNAGDDGFENPRAAAFDSEGNLWIVDFRRNSLRAFNLDGQLLFVQEGPQSDNRGFSTPVAIHIDANDEIFVADFAAGRFSHWRYLSKSALARHPVTAEDMETAERALSGGVATDTRPPSLRR